MQSMKRATRNDAIGQLCEKKVVTGIYPVQLFVAHSRAISDGGHCAGQQSETVVGSCNRISFSAGGGL